MVGTAIRSASLDIQSGSTQLAWQFGCRIQELRQRC
jgi:hypothetical protein